MKTYNASQLAEHLRDHKLMIAFAPYENPYRCRPYNFRKWWCWPICWDITRQIT